MSIVEAAVVFESGCFPICHPEDVILTGFEDIERVVCLEIIAIFIDHMRRVIVLFSQDNHKETKKRFKLSGSTGSCDPVWKAKYCCPVISAYAVTLLDNFILQ